ncbi:MAG: SHOCT domain-containing protein [Rhodoglobus sp.]|jgi:hypothetical protein|nr:SHOCT domain-containing protein [Rhodoglobus sp.]
MTILSDFWGFLWSAFVIFAFIAYLMVLFSIIGDLFRDRALGGGYKAIWIIFLVALPFLTALVYLIARGRGMAERQAEQASAARAATEAYIKEAAGTGPASEIAQAKALLEAGTISEAEFDKLKKKALS